MARRRRRKVLEEKVLKTDMPSFLGKHFCLAAGRGKAPGAKEDTMKKDDVVEILIEDQTEDGLGIGRWEQMAVFVKDTVIGDFIRASIMKVKKSYAYGRLLEVLQPSPDRVLAPCSAARPCGGCQLQALSYPAQLKFKENKVRTHLMRIGGFLNVPMEPVIGMEFPLHYRNKAQYPVGVDREGNLVAGFYAGHTHQIIGCQDCMLGAPEDGRILRLTLEYMREFQVPPYEERTGSGLVRHVMIRTGFFTGQVQVCLVLNGDRLPAANVLVQKLRNIPGMTGILINSNRENTNVILGQKTRLLWGKPYLEDTIGDLRFQISPQSFYQVNPLQTKRLYETVLAYAGLTGRETVWDLYCGIGTISLFLAKWARQVYGVEIVPEAVADAKRNARLNGIANAAFFAGRAEEVVPEKYEREHVRADVCVIDPPRKGCEKQVLETLVNMAPSRIVYVSCDSATLSRDLKVLCAGGYRLERCRAVDMFPMTTHVETVCLLTQRRLAG